MTGSEGLTAAVRALNADGSGWVLGERLAGGVQSGAWRLDGPGGSTAVLKVAQTADWSAQVLRAAEAVRAVRRGGYPTPDWLATGTTASGLAYQVQDFVPGRSIEVVDRSCAEALVQVIEQQHGLDPDPDRCWNDHLAVERRRGIDRFRAATDIGGGSGSALIDRCRELAVEAEQVDWPRRDMVHGDFRPANVLVDRSGIPGDVTVTAVVDIEAIGSGTRAFDYATLLTAPRIEPDAFELIVRAGSASAPVEVFRACVSHVFLDLVRFIARVPGVADSDRDRERRRVDTIRQLAARADRIATATSPGTIRVSSC
ncbi:phosphotransferase family protein [Curtobacterium sp. Leaf261]|uniref:phosphotransferase family protein n=1 Tax=Curtobacterium sp. Leaf261 TaxID=1736311 RepID=UPI0007021A28|nr:aminoglycoside phosphotransferase family protein [Curtobacterium sp. Leaf261]KQO64874.1 hypothetical protein ASF23_01450 [Curtobacterium sp. Leaf261]